MSENKTTMYHLTTTKYYISQRIDADAKLWHHIQFNARWEVCNIIFLI